MVGWEKEVVKELKRIWETGERAWFLEKDDYDEFNKKSVEFYKNYSPEKLISEWEMWQKALAEEIKSIGGENIRKRPYMKWVFDEGENSHHGHHYEQIKKVIEEN